MKLFSVGSALSKFIFLAITFFVSAAAFLSISTLPTPAKPASAQTNPTEAVTVLPIANAYDVAPVVLDLSNSEEPMADFQPAPKDQNDDVMVAKTAGEISSVIFDEPSMYDMYVGKNETKQRAPLHNSPCKISLSSDVDFIQQTFIGKVLKNRYDNGARIEGERAALIALANLLQVAADNGFRLMNVRSGYRSFDTQTLITRSAALPVGIDQAAPGRSEHQLGTSFDVGWGNLALSYHEILTTREAARFYAWLWDHAHEFGFVISFPYKAVGKDTNAQKPFITEYVADPWHIRYVTKPFAFSIWSFRDANGENYLSSGSSLTPADFYRSASTGACLPEDR